MVVDPSWSDVSIRFRSVLGPWWWILDAVTVDPRYGHSVGSTTTVLAAVILDAEVAVKVTMRV